MLSSASKRPRLPKRAVTEEQFDRMLEITSRLATILVATVVMVATLKVGHAILTPVALAIVGGLMFGPVADRLEQRGMAPAASAGIVVLIFLALAIVSILMLAVPLAEWVGRIPEIWQRIQTELLNWKEPLEALSSAEEQLSNALGSGSAVEVTVQDGSQVMTLAMIAPAILGDILIFLVSLYFYLATRESIRVSILSMLVTRRLRWRTAHVFSQVENGVSRFLLSVTLLNVGVGIVMAIVTWAFGMPSPLLWGAFAGVLNYIPYVGQAVMIAILLAVGFATQPDLLLILAPVGVYMLVNLVEGQFLFPAFVGRMITLNPFLIFLSIIFWIFVWGPVGSLMAVPSLIILQAIATNILPSKDVKPRRPVRRTADMSAKDVVLANAAKAIREQAADEQAAASAAADAPAKAEAPAPAIALEAPPPAARKRAAPKRRAVRRDPVPAK